jgi:hypothetical protein
MMGAIAVGGQLLGGMMAGDAQKEAANKAYKAQKESMLRMQEMLESIGIPTTEAQRIVLETPEYAGDLITENLGPSAMEEIKTDTKMESVQMKALRQLQETGKVGMTPEERAEREEMLRQGASQGQAAQKQILQSMAQRGTLDAGASLIAQLQANTAQSTDARRQSEQMSSDVANRRREAIMRAANMAGNMKNADFNRQANIASAKDRINQFNTQNRQSVQERNLNARQGQSTMEADASNQQQLHNKALIQQDYQNRMAKANTMAGIESKMGNAAADRAKAVGSANANMYSGMGNAIGTAATGFGKNSALQAANTQKQSNWQQEMDYKNRKLKAEWG